MILPLRTLDKQWEVQTRITLTTCSSKFWGNNRRSLQVWAMILTITCIGDNKNINHLDQPIQITKLTYFHSEKRVQEMLVHSGWREMVKAEWVLARPLIQIHRFPTRQTRLCQSDHSMKSRTHRIWSRSGLSIVKSLISMISVASETWLN